MTVLCPSERFDEQQGRCHQTLGARAWQSIHVVVRWVPARDLGLVADSRGAARELRHEVSKLPRAHLVTRLRLDSALEELPPERHPGPLGRPRLNGPRRPTLEALLADADTPWSKLTVERWDGDACHEVDVVTDTVVWSHAGKPPVRLRWVLIRDPHQCCQPQAWLSTNLDYTPEQILTWCIRRLSLEVTREEARAHLGMETLRQWPVRAMARTTPALLSLYSIMTLTAHQLLRKESTVVRVSAW
jgi:hypothetical protein